MIQEDNATELCKIKANNTLYIIVSTEGCYSIQGTLLSSKGLSLYQKAAFGFPYLRQPH